MPLLNRSIDVAVADGYVGLLENELAVAHIVMEIQAHISAILNAPRFRGFPSRLKYDSKGHGDFGRPFGGLEASLRRIYRQEAWRRRHIFDGRYWHVRVLAVFHAE